VFVCLRRGKFSKAEIPEDVAKLVEELRAGRLSQRVFLLALFERSISDAGLIKRWTGIPRQTYTLSSTGRGREGG